MKKITAKIYGAKYLFRSEIDEEFLNGLIKTFSMSRKRQTPENFVIFCKVSFNVDVQFINRILTFNRIKA